jgi:hypothetical protein
MGQLLMTKKAKKILGCLSKKKVKLWVLYEKKLRLIVENIAANKEYKFLKITKQCRFLRYLSIKTS